MFCVVCKFAAKIDTHLFGYLLFFFFLITILLVVLI